MRYPAILKTLVAARRDRTRLPCRHTTVVLKHPWGIFQCKMLVRKKSPPRTMVARSPSVSWTAEEGQPLVEVEVVGEEAAKQQWRAVAGAEIGEKVAWGGQVVPQWAGDEGGTGERGKVRRRRWWCATVRWHLTCACEGACTCASACWWEWDASWLGRCA